MISASYDASGLKVLTRRPSRHNNRRARHMLAVETMSRRVSNAPVSLDVSGDVGIIAMSNPPVNALAIPGARPDRPPLLFPRNGDLTPAYPNFIHAADALRNATPLTSVLPRPATTRAQSWRV